MEWLNRHVDGWVLHQRRLIFGDLTADDLFGPSQDPGEMAWENILINGLHVFRSEADKDAALKAIRAERSFDCMRLGSAYLRMEVYPYEPGRIHLPERGSFVVIKISPEFQRNPKIKELEMYGRSTGRVCSGMALYGNPLMQNGLQPFTSLQRAIFCADEVNRQAASPACIATFDLRQRITKQNPKLGY